MENFDPSTTISADFGIFGIPSSEETSQVILLPVPWEVTTSYGSGASAGPELIRNESIQIDLFDLELGNAYEAGYFLKETPEHILKLNNLTKPKAQEVIRLRTEMSKEDSRIETLVQEVNDACNTMTDWVYTESKKVISQKKVLGLIGGDHSTPLGAIRALSEFYTDYSVLHIDAHADLRKSYQGFHQSHASIMYNVMNLYNAPKTLVQLGIRDFCQEEFEFIERHKQIHTYFDYNLKKDLFSGFNWMSLCENVIKNLSKNVYISFDIDGLDPQFCPHTGTPVPGGLTTDQVFFLFSLLSQSGRKIIGFDVNEVSSGGGPLEEAQWDGNVGARVLYKLCGWASLRSK